MSSQRPSQSDGNGFLVPAIILFGGMTLLLMGLLASRPSAAPAKTSEAAATSAVSSPEATEAAQTVALALDPAKVKAGESSFQAVCTACHGFNARGISGLGKTLIGSEFVNGLTDDQLVAFLQVGRPVSDPLNTTGVMMPARGGNATLTDDKLMEIVAYIRSLNQPSAQGDVAAAPTAAPTSSEPVATSAPFTGIDLSGLAVPTSVSGTSESTAVPTEVPAAAAESAAYVPAGKALYEQSCAGCHGLDGTGVQNVAKPLADSALLKSGNGIGLLDFLINGDPALNPQHPYRGGYPERSDIDLLDIIGYLYSLSTGK
ncbi:MAG: c-type cytochrome [Anaerolineaceae bacterium]|nr:c-type cytochrome [Anaerolineaceae bacterium]